MLKVIAWTHAILKLLRDESWIKRALGYLIKTALCLLLFLLSVTSPLKTPIFDLFRARYSYLAYREFGWGLAFCLVFELLIVFVWAQNWFESTRFNFFYDVLMVLNLPFTHVDIVYSISPLYISMIKAITCFCWICRRFIYRLVLLTYLLLSIKLYRRLRPRCLCLLFRSIFGSLFIFHFTHAHFIKLFGSRLLRLLLTRLNGMISLSLTVENVKLISISIMILIIGIVLYKFIFSGEQCHLLISSTIIIIVLANSHRVCFSFNTANLLITLPVIARDWR